MPTITRCRCGPVDVPYSVCGVCIWYVADYMSSKFRIIDLSPWPALYWTNGCSCFGYESFYAHTFIIFLFLLFTKNDAHAKLCSPSAVSSKYECCIHIMLYFRRTTQQGSVKCWANPIFFTLWAYTCTVNLDTLSFMMHYTVWCDESSKLTPRSICSSWASCFKLWTDFSAIFARDRVYAMTKCFDFGGDLGHSVL